MQVIKIYRDTSATSYFMVDWMLHDKCTYDCSYCPPANKSGTDTLLDLETLNEMCDAIEEHAHSIDPTFKIHVLFTGGEPTVWKDFGELVNRVAARGWVISVNSNGSRSERWWEEYASKFIHIILSYHTESVDDDEFMNKLKICSKYSKTSVNLMLNTHPEYFDKAIQFSKRITTETNNIHLTHHRIQHNFGLQEINVPFYTNEQKNIISTLEDSYPQIYYNQLRSNFRVQYADLTTEKLNTAELLNTNTANFKDWMCHAGNEGIFIDANGKVLRATCRVGEELGNIKNPREIKWPKDPILCPYSWCGCTTDIANSKEAP